MEPSQYPFNPEFNAAISQENSSSRKLIAYQYARSVKLFSVIDGIFCFLYLFYFYWPSVFSGLFILAGYFGAKNYNKNLILVYAIYELLDIGFDIYLLYYIYSNYDVYYGYIFSIFSIVIQVYILRIIFKCYQSIKDLRVEEILELKNGWIPGQVVFLYW